MSLQSKKRELEAMVIPDLSGPLILCQEDSDRAVSKDKNGKSVGSQ
jgi:hypothetical protein